MSVTNSPHDLCKCLPSSSLTHLCKSVFEKNIENPKITWFRLTRQHSRVFYRLDRCDLRIRSVDSNMSVPQTVSITGASVCVHPPWHDCTNPFSRTRKMTFRPQTGIVMCVTKDEPSRCARMWRCWGIVLGSCWQVWHADHVYRVCRANGCNSLQVASS